MINRLPQEYFSSFDPDAGKRGVTQTILHDDPVRQGNCFAACIATLYEWPLHRFPHFVEWGMALSGPDDRVAWWAMFCGFVAADGFSPVRLGSLVEAFPDELVLVSGPSPRGVPHQVIYRNSILWWDPHPSRSGLASVNEEDLMVLRKHGRGSFSHRPTPKKEQP